MVFLGVFELSDGVVEVVKKSYEAKVNVIMITWDNIVTVTAIAKECGILQMRSI